MFLVAYVPPLWRYVMDERLLRTAGRDANCLNLDPRQREALIARYGLTTAA
jgi:alkane 1-monooxygenase